MYGTIFESTLLCVSLFFLKTLRQVKCLAETRTSLFLLFFFFFQILPDE